MRPHISAVTAKTPSRVWETAVGQYLYHNEYIINDNAHFCKGFRKIRKEFVILGRIREKFGIDNVENI